LKLVIQEIVAVSQGRQIKLDEGVTDKVLAIIDKLPEETMASMQRDILEGRPSELGSQNGAVVRQGLEGGIPTPANTFIYNSLLPKELRARGKLRF
jgi:2-dehydropantoate 2-reductase